MSTFAVAAIAGCGLVGWRLSEGAGVSASASPFPAAARSGLVLSWTSAGTLLESRPDGRQVRALSGLGQFPFPGLPSIAPGGGLVAFPDGQIVAAGSGGPGLFKDRLTLGRDQVLPARSAFSAGGGYVVVLTEGRFGNPGTIASVSVVNLRTGASTSLGTGSFAAGDPSRPGALIGVASPSQAGVGIGNTATADSELDLVDAGRPPVPLASASSLAQAVGLDPSTPVSLLPVPNPAGSLIAVDVDDLLDSPGSADGLVVLDRGGKIVAVRDRGQGSSGAFPVWSPDGAALAYVNVGTHGNAISIWTVGAGVASASLPSGVGAGQCLWSPAGTAVLCDSSHSLQGRLGQTWSVTTLLGGHVASRRGPGFAIDWYRG